MVRFNVSKSPKSPTGEDPTVAVVGAEKTPTNVGNTTADPAVPTPVKTVDGPTQPKKDATPISAHPITNIADEVVDESTKTGDVAEQVAETAVVANGKTTSEPTKAVVAENSVQVVEPTKAGDVIVVANGKTTTEPMKAGDVIVVANGKTTAEPTKSVAADAAIVEPMKTGDVAAKGTTATEPKAAIDVNATVAPSETQLATTEAVVVDADAVAEIQKATTEPTDVDPTEAQQEKNDPSADTRDDIMEPELLAVNTRIHDLKRKFDESEAQRDTVIAKYKRIHMDMETLKVKYDHETTKLKEDNINLKNKNKKLLEDISYKKSEVFDYEMCARVAYDMLSVRGVTRQDVIDAKAPETMVVEYTKHIKKP
jgi:hypothetical protein